MNINRIGTKCSDAGESFASKNAFGSATINLVDNNDGAGHKRMHRAHIRKDAKCVESVRMMDSNAGDGWAVRESLRTRRRNNIVRSGIGPIPVNRSAAINVIFPAFDAKIPRKNHAICNKRRHRRGGSYHWRH